MKIRYNGLVVHHYVSVAQNSFLFNMKCIACFGEMALLPLTDLKYICEFLHVQIIQFNPKGLEGHSPRLYTGTYHNI